MAAQRRVVLPDLELFRLQLFIAGGGVARRGLAFLARFGAFDGDNFAGHGLFLFFGLFFGLFLFGFGFGLPDSIDGAEGAEAALAQRAVALQLGLGLDGE